MIRFSRPDEVSLSDLYLGQEADQDLNHNLMLQVRTATDFMVLAGDSICGPADQTAGKPCPQPLCSLQAKPITNIPADL